ncbi:transcriptional regulator BetI [Alkalimarinus coralli]|uniref:transcriptional regulator BetI n=1 Tax=Alkalimarinus coralli TaxID=2935863 RepID=UPI00202B5639|nr:transcriptional regulator BetI [Alkalimarinus coralli]
MPKVGIEPIRKKQLIEATLSSIGTHGLQGTTINTISGIAGLSSGIISHYFGGKQGLIKATVRYLLDQLKVTLLNSAEQKALSPKQRLMMIVEANFTNIQQSDEATRTWLSFWAQAMHDPELAKLQRVNSQRLLSNLRYSFKQLMPPDKAIDAAKITAAMIDGFWLRSALSDSSKGEFKEAEMHCKQVIDTLILQYGEQS